MERVHGGDAYVRVGWGGVGTHTARRLLGMEQASVSRWGPQAREGRGTRATRTTGRRRIVLNIHVMGGVGNKNLVWLQGGSGWSKGGVGG